MLQILLYFTYSWILNGRKLFLWAMLRDCIAQIFFRIRTYTKLFNQMRVKDKRQLGFIWDLKTFYGERVRRTDLLFEIFKFLLQTMEHPATGTQFYPIYLFLNLTMKIFMYVSPLFSFYICSLCTIYRITFLSKYSITYYYIYLI